MQAQDVMTTKVTTIEAGATVREAARRMLERRVSALPVVDDRGRVIGIVSEGDLVRRTEVEQKALRAAAKAVAGRRKVADHTVVLPPLVVAGLGAV